MFFFNDLYVSKLSKYFLWPLYTVNWGQQSIYKQIQAGLDWVKKKIGPSILSQTGPYGHNKHIHDMKVVLLTAVSILTHLSLLSSSATRADEGPENISVVLTHFTVSAWTVCFFFFTLFLCTFLAFLLHLSDYFERDCTLALSQMGEVFEDVIGPAQCQSRK